MTEVFFVIQGLTQNLGKKKKEIKNQKIKNQSHQKE